MSNSSRIRQVSPPLTRRSLSTLNKAGNTSCPKTKSFKSKGRQSKLNILRWFVRPVNSNITELSNLSIYTNPAVSNSTQKSCSDSNDSKPNLKKVVAVMENDYDKMSNGNKISRVLSANSENLSHEKEVKNELLSHVSLVDDSNNSDKTDLSEIVIKNTTDSAQKVFNCKNKFVASNIHGKKSCLNKVSSNPRKATKTTSRTDKIANNSEEEFVSQLDFSYYENLRNDFVNQQTRNSKNGNVQNGNRIFIKPLPSAYIPCDLSCNCSKINDTLQSIKNLADKLLQTENFIENLLVRYILDEKVEEQLIEALRERSQIQQETLGRVIQITHDLHAKEIESCNIQNSYLNQTVETLLKENRKLQDENNELLKRIEKLNVSSSSFKHYFKQKQPKKCFIRFSGVDETRNDETFDLEKLISSSKTDSLIARINDKLRSRLTSATIQIENLERELIQFQKNENDLNTKLKELQLQFENEVSASHRVKVQDDLLITKLQQEVAVKSKLLKETEEAVQVLISDIELIKQLLKKCPKFKAEINLDKINPKNSLTSLIHECRIFISSLGFEIIESQHTIQITKNDTGKLSSELNLLKKDLETALVDYENISTDLEEMRTKYKINDRSKFRIEEICNINSSLDGKSLPEKLVNLQRQCCQLTTEKDSLLDQIKTFNLERGTIVQYQNAYYEHLTLQRVDLERLNEFNQQLWQELTRQRDALVALEFQKTQLEKQVQNLETNQKTAESDADRIRELEQRVLKIRLELNNMTLVANYNQHISEDLQKTIMEKDSVITNLEAKISDLQNRCLCDAKDKVALSNEVSKLSDQRKQLQCAIEQQKHFVEICECKTKKEATKDKQSQLSERSSLIELSKEYQKVVDEKDQLLNVNNRLTLQIERLKRDEEETKQFCQHLGAECISLAEKVKTLDNNINEMNAQLQKTTEQKVMQENRAKESGLLIKRLQNELDDTKNDYKNLQCTIKKQNDEMLNISKVYQETLVVLDEERKVNSELKEGNQKLSAQLDESKGKNNEYVKNMDGCRNEICELKKVNQKLAAQLDESKEKHNEYVKNMEGCRNEICELKEVNQKLSAQLDESKEKHNEYVKNMDGCRNEIYELKEVNQKLSAQLDESKEKHNEYVKNMDGCPNEICELKEGNQKLSAQLDECKENNNECVKNMDDCRNEIRELKNINQSSAEQLLKKENMLCQNLEEFDKLQKENITLLAILSQIKKNKGNVFENDQSIDECTNRVTDLENSNRSLSELTRERDLTIRRLTEDFVSNSEDEEQKKYINTLKQNFIILQRGTTSYLEGSVDLKNNFDESSEVVEYNSDHCNEEISELMKAYKEMTDALVESNMKIAQHVEEHDKLTMELEESKKMVKQLEATVETLRSKIRSSNDRQMILPANNLSCMKSNFDSRLIQSNHKIQVKMETVNSDFNQELRNIKKTHDELAHQLLSAITMLIDERLARQQVEQKLNELVIVNEVIERHSLQTDTKLSETCDRVLQLTEANQKLRTELENLRVQLDEANDRGTRNENEVIKFKETLELVESEAERNRSLAEERISFDEFVLKDNNSKIAHLQRTACLLTKMVDDKHIDNVNLQKKLSDLETEIVKLEFDLKQMVSQQFEIQLIVDIERMLKEQALGKIDQFTKKIQELKLNNQISMEAREALFAILQTEFI